MEERVLKDKNIKMTIAKRVAQELKSGDVVNLGIGLPTLVPEFVPAHVSVILQSENGIIGMQKAKEDKEESIINAGGVKASVGPGGSFINSVDSFAFIRGGHVDVCVLGALEVDEKGNLANWSVPGKFVPGMGGAMDLVCGAKKVIVAMQHTSKGEAKILKDCTLPLTATGVVKLVITEYGVLEVTPRGFLLTELAQGTTIEELKRMTEATFEIAQDLKIMQIK